MDELLPPEMLGPAAHQRSARVERPAPEAQAPESTTKEPEQPAAEATSEATAAKETPAETLTRQEHEAEVARRIEAYAKKRDADALARIQTEASERAQRERRELAEKARQGDLEAQARLAEDVAAQFERERAQRELLPTAWQQAVGTLQRQAQEAYGDIPALKNPAALEKVVAASTTDTKSWLTTMAAEVAAERDAYWKAEIEKLKAPDGPIAATIRSQLRDLMPNPDTADQVGGAGVGTAYNSEAKIRSALANGQITTREARHYASLLGIDLTRRPGR